MSGLGSSAKAKERDQAWPEALSRAGPAGWGLVAVSLLEWAEADAEAMVVGREKDIGSLGGAHLNPHGPTVASSYAPPYRLYGLF
jgi:hypothetical protein